MNDAFSAWRTREGTTLLIFYALIIAAVSGAFTVSGEPARLQSGLPAWLPLVPIALPALLLGIAAWPAVRPYAYRMQMLNVGVFLVVLVAVFLGHRYTPESLLIAVVCMFAVHHAFMRWQELVTVYSAVPLLFATVSASHGTLWRSASINTLGVLIIVSALCVGLGSLRLRSMYAAALERFRLERQTAELRRQTERNARMACTDSLTGLLNRFGMNDLIDRALGLSRSSDAKSALLYIDLDGFKHVNDVCGHDAGDLVLVEAALRIQYLLRAGESAGRVGGDEFVIVQPSVHSAEEAQALARRIEGVFAEAFIVGDSAFVVGASIGIAVSGADGGTRLELLSAADKSMYAAKRRRKTGHRLAAASGGGSGI